MSSIASALVYALGAGCLLAIVAFSFAPSFYLRAFRIDFALAIAMGAASVTMLSPVVGTILSAIACAAIAAAIEMLVLRAEAERGAGLLEQMLTCTAIFLLGLGGLHVWLGSEPLLTTSPPHAIVAGIHIPLATLPSVLVVAACIALASPRGNARRVYLAIIDDDRLARALGLPARRTRTLAAAAGGALASIAGSIVAYDRSTDIYSALDLLVAGIAVVLVASAPRISAIVLTALIIGAAEEACVRLIGNVWRTFPVYMALFIRVATARRSRADTWKWL